MPGQNYPNNVWPMAEIHRYFHYVIIQSQENFQVENIYLSCKKNEENWEKLTLE